MTGSYLFVSLPKYQLPIPGAGSSCGDNSFSDGIWLFFLASSSFCDFCRRTEDEYEVFIVLVLAEDINCHPGQSGKVPLYWQFPPEPHIYISGKSGSSCWWWGGWGGLIYVFRGNQALVYGDDESEHLVIYIWGKLGSCDCKLSLCTKKLSNGWAGYVFLEPKIGRNA